jgi:hypothetical protein
MSVDLSRWPEVSQWSVVAWRRQTVEEASHIGVRQDELKEKSSVHTACDTHQCRVEVVSGSYLRVAVGDVRLHNLAKKISKVKVQLWSKGIDWRRSDEGAHW